VKAQLDAVEGLIARSRKPGGYHVVHSDRAAFRRRIEAGCRFMAYGTEMVFLGEKLRDEGGFIAAVRGERP
jgi:2-dehydro-3-deoxyglucarate aldolase